METKERKAIEYSKKVSQHPVIIEYVECAFKAGWDCSLKNKWISVNDELPEIDKKVFVLVEYMGMIQVHTFKYYGEKEWKFGDSKVLAWMPIPSFDEILKQNKDVLERLKIK